MKYIVISYRNMSVFFCLSFLYSATTNEHDIEKIQIRNKKTKQKNASINKTLGTSTIMNEKQKTYKTRSWSFNMPKLYNLPVTQRPIEPAAVCSRYCLAVTVNLWLMLLRRPRPLPLSSNWYRIWAARNMNSASCLTFSQNDERHRHDMVWTRRKFNSIFGCC